MYMMLKMFKILSYVFIFFVLSFKLVFSEIISKIEINGNTRLTEESIIVFGDIKLNSNFDDQELDLILKKLYKTNFFSNIDLLIKDQTLFINVKENPVIQKTEFVGVPNKSIRKELKNLISMKDKSPFVKNSAKNDLRKVKNYLKSVGYYFVDVNPTIIENSNNTIDLIYNVKLGQKALIGKIKFIGDKKIKDRKLRNVIVSEENKFWKLLSTKKFLDENRIKFDVRLLTNYYKNKGYYSVKIENSSAKFYDNNRFDLIFNITAGDKFVFNNLKLDLPQDYDRENFIEIENVLKSLKNTTYSYSKIQDILDEIDKIALGEQYEFIDAEVEESIQGTNKLDFTVIVKETEKFYVERINIYGNNVTREQVLRDQFIVDEGDAFNKILHNKSINTLKSLNIFKSVSSEVEDGSSPNQKIINMTVEEKPTGEISAGAGLGTSGGSVSFSVKENNYMGKGITVNTAVSVGKDTLKGVVSFTNPNFNYSDKEITTSLQSLTTDRLGSSGYKTTKTGLTFGTAFEQYEDFYISPSITSFFEQVETSSVASAALKKQNGDYFDTNFVYSLNYDKRNQAFTPTDGFRSYFTQTLPVLADDKTIKNSYEFSSHHEFIEDMIGSLTFYTSAINSISSDDVRVSRRLYASEKRLRGFESGKVGPKDGEDYVGGNYVTALNLSTTLPKLFSNVQNIDFIYFLDAANVWGVDYSSSIDESSKIRSSTGFGVDWFTPVGPLNFSLSQPITKASTDKTETFRFNIGTTF